MRALPLLAATCLAAAFVAEGCGGDGEPRAARAAAPVELELSAPADLAVVREEQVAVQGTVSPARATVHVLGQAADVTGGRFTATVALEAGVNVIDVIATAAGREAAMSAIRVTREVPVEVPDLDGMDAEEAQQELGDVGLELKVQEEPGGFIDELLPGDPAVCAQDPEPGAEVRRGTVVRVLISKGC
jgi:hypothetical protein